MKNAEWRIENVALRRFTSRRLPIRHASFSILHSAFRPAFTLVELVMVTIIISLLASIAVPRITYAGAAARANSLAQTVATINEATQWYFAEHSRYPGAIPGTNTPDGTWFQRQLLEYTDTAGQAQATLGYPFLYGPYLRAPFPQNPLNGMSTVRVIATKATAVAAGSSGWVAVLSTGEFRLNSTTAELEGAGISDGKMVSVILNGEAL